MPELWTSSGGVNRKLKELYTPSGGVNRKLKDLYAVSGGVNRKIFSGEVPYTLSIAYSKTDTLGNFGTAPYLNSNGSGGFEWNFSRGSSKTWQGFIIDFLLVFSEPINCYDFIGSNSILFDPTGINLRIEYDYGLDADANDLFGSYNVRYMDGGTEKTIERIRQSDYEFAPNGGNAAPQLLLSDIQNSESAKILAGLTAIQYRMISQEKLTIDEDDYAWIYGSWSAGSIKAFEQALTQNGSLQ
ncbi:hypothetical protein [Faecalispora sporosphaeroides]|uniref:Uncharacterized protein n=1 Tax=Faecalispora sporosphaeroides TaxID=1549 RepID=A0A928KTC7_9FIRM|nr:hypothetical protein [Faecalispora sporosphaeroides]MBE6834185.1 hypothetical protein [Faecalispora sporosphaeroides]